MAWYYSASERAFFSSDIMTTGSMPADKVAVTDSDYEDLMDDQVNGLLIRPGSGNAPESASQNLTTASRFGNVSFGKVTATGLDLNGNADISGTLVVTGASTLKGALAAQGGLTTTTITATGTSTLAAVNATNISASGTLKVNGASTLKAVSATNITASGTLAVRGTSTFTGKVTANGGLTTKALTATSLDLNGAGDISGNLSVGGLLTVTGDIKGQGFVDTENSSGKGFRLIDSRLDLVDGQSYQIQDWPVRVVDKDGRTAAMVKYYNNSDGSSTIVLADVSYSSEDDQSGNWAQVTFGHKAGGTPFLETALPTSLKGGLAVSGGALTVAGAGTFTNGLTVSGARAIFNHDIDANGALSVTKTLTAKGALSVTGAATFSNTVTASKAIRSTDSLSAPMLYLGGTGAHIVRQLTNITKGTAPSSNVYVGNFLYPSGATNAVSNRIAGNEISIGTGGITTYTFTCYENAASSTNAALLRLGYAGEPYINLSADNINVSGMLNTFQGITSAKGIAVKTGNISCTNGTFVGNSTVNFAHNDTIIVNGQGSGSDQQRWPLAVYDKNGNSLAYCKFLQTAAGQNRWQFLVTYRNSSGSNTMAGLEVRNDTSGNFYTTAVTPAKDSNGTDIATTEWVVSQLSTSIPAGAIMYFAQSNVPDGWLFCNGSNVSRTTYANLFAAIGTKYGSGNGSSTFTLPNLRDIFIQGASSTSNVGQSVAAGLPNITGAFTALWRGYYANQGETSGALAIAEKWSANMAHGESDDWGANYSLDASRSSGIYGQSSTVQPPALRLLPCIKI